MSIQYNANTFHYNVNPSNASKPFNVNTFHYNVNPSNASKTFNVNQSFKYI